jgi:hypothetical protein
LGLKGWYTFKIQIDQPQNSKSLTTAKDSDNAQLHDPACECHFTVGSAFRVTGGVTLAGSFCGELESVLDSCASKLFNDSESGGELTCRRCYKTFFRRYCYNRELLLKGKAK